MRAGPGYTRIPVRGADGFLLALDGFMRRTGQGAHLSQSILELESAPDLERLRGGLRRVVEKHPLLAGRLRRSWKTWLAYWEVPTALQEPLPLGLWREAGAPGVLGAEAREVASATERLQRIMAAPLGSSRRTWNARLDLVELTSGRCLVALSWRHTLIDGKGAELLLVEIARLCEGIDLPATAADKQAPVRTPLKEQLRKTKPAVARFQELARLRFPSLGGPKPREGRSLHRVITLSAADSAKARTRADGLTGALFPMAFYMAAAARAHDRVFRERGKTPAGLMVSVPIQTRKRGAQGPLFHNQVTVFFFAAAREDLGTIEASTAAMKRQFAEMSRARLDESFNSIAEMMMRLPSAFFLRVVRWQFAGEIGSFFHSHTGPFAAEIQQFAGGAITNGYHLPGVGIPPGTGIFFSERDGRLTMTISWREGAMTPGECALLEGQALEDLLGEPRPDLQE